MDTSLPLPSTTSRPGSRRRTGREGRELRFAWIMVVGLGAVLLGTLVLPVFRFMDVWPDLVTLVVLWHALYGDPKGRYAPALAVGVFRDVFSTCTFGTFTLLYGLLHRVVASRRYALRRENPVAQVILAFISVLMVNLGVHLVMTLAGNGIGWSAALRHAATIASMTAPLFPLVCLGMHFALKACGSARRTGENWAV